MNIYILLVSVVIIACIVGNKVSNKLGIPMLLVFILLGMFFGSDGVIRIPFDNFKAAENICSIALIFIMFYGGFGTKWQTAKPVAGRAVLLSTAGVVMTAGLVGLFCHFVLKVGMVESFLLGSLVSSTDAASVFSILRSKRLNLKYRTASLLEVESGSNDPCSYMLTMIIISILSGDNPTAGHIAYLVFAQFVYGTLIGVVLAFLTVFVLNRVKFSTEGFDTIFVFAIVLLSYVIPSAVGGNGYLSAYLFGIILGNMRLGNKKTLVNFFDGLTGLMQMLVFFLLGLLSFPSEFPKVIIPGFAIAVFLTFVARPLAVFMLLTPFKCPLRQQILVSVAGLRGAASIVFAIITITNLDTVQYDVFHMVFFIVLFSILLQGMLLPVMAQKLDMIDESEDVLKTFTDYTDDVPVQFIQFTVREGHPWEGKKIREIILPPETILVQIQKGDSIITPTGNTVLEKGNILILSARAPMEEKAVRLTELELENDNDWVGKRIAEIRLGPGKLILTIQRNGDVVIPNGGTILQQGDVLMMKEG